MQWDGPIFPAVANWTWCRYCVAYLTISCVSCLLFFSQHRHQDLSWNPLLARSACFALLDWGFFFFVELNINKRWFFILNWWYLSSLLTEVLGWLKSAHIIEPNYCSLVIFHLPWLHIVFINTIRRGRNSSLVQVLLYNNILSVGLLCLSWTEMTVFEWTAVRTF